MLCVLERSHDDVIVMVVVVLLYYHAIAIVNWLSTNILH
jgi:hypothetical protein